MVTCIFGALKLEVRFKEPWNKLKKATTVTVRSRTTGQLRRGEQPPGEPWASARRQQQRAAGSLAGAAARMGR